VRWFRVYYTRTFAFCLRKKTWAVLQIVASSRAVFGGQIDRIPEWNGLLPLNQSGLVRFMGPNSLTMAVCFSERADRSRTIFWMLSEEIRDSNALWYQFDQGLECRERLLKHCKQLISNGTWHENLQKLVHEMQTQQKYSDRSSSRLCLHLFALVCGASHCLIQIRCLN